MARHPIALLDLQFVKTSVESLAGYQAVDFLDPGKVVNNISITPPEEDEDDIWFARMSTSVNPSGDIKHPYRIEMDAIARLQADMTQLSTDDAARGVAITAHSVLYGAIRESVLWITGRHPFGPLMLSLSVLTPPAKPAAEDSPMPE